MAAAMRTNLKCFISCILPCGSFDVVRIIHSDGHLQEIAGTVKASEIMELYPKHILKKPSSHGDEVCGGAVTVPPNAELRRGEVYLLTPLPERTQRRKGKGRSHSDGDIEIPKLQYPENEDLIRKGSGGKGNRRHRVRVWRPRMDSISETP